MGLSLKTAPSDEPLDLATVKAHLRVDTTADDGLIGALIVAAREHVEGEVLQRSLLTQTWQWALDCFPRDRIFRVPRPRLQSVSSIKYIDLAGATQTLDPSRYLVDLVSEIGRIAPAYNTYWPPVLPVVNAVTIEFVAGYGDDAGDVPQRIKQAMLLIIGHWYENRDAVGANIPDVAANLLGTFRAF